MPALGFDDVALLGVGTAIAIAGAVASVRLWLRGSWHVITVAGGTWIAMVLIGAGFVLLSSAADPRSSPAHAAIPRVRDPILVRW